MNNDYDKYTVVFDSEKIQSLYTEWNWLIDQKYLQDPWLMTSFGDLFFKGPDGSIHFIDTIEGVITPFAENEENGVKKLLDPKIQDQYLGVSAIEGLVERGLILKENELYIYVPHPKIAGKIDADSIQIMSMNVVISLCGQLLRQINPQNPSR